MEYLKDISVAGGTEEQPFARSELLARERTRPSEHGDFCAPGANFNSFEVEIEGFHHSGSSDREYKESCEPQILPGIDLSFDWEDFLFSGSDNTDSLNVATTVQPCDVTASLTTIASSPITGLDPNAELNWSSSTSTERADDQCPFADCSRSHAFSRNDNLDQHLKLKHDAAVRSVWQYRLDGQGGWRTYRVVKPRRSGKKKIAPKNKGSSPAGKNVVKKKTN